MRMSSIARVGTVFLMIALVLAGCSRSPEAKKARYLERGNRYFKQEQYREAVQDVKLLLEGRDKELADELEARMLKASEELRFEQAAKNIARRAGGNGTGQHDDFRRFQ